MSTLFLKAGLAAFFFASLAAGCTTTRTVDSGFPEAYREISERAAGYTVEVALLGGKRHAAQMLHLRPDSASWYDPGEEDVVSVATGEIVEIRNVVHRGRGALHGLGLGVASGLVSGAVLGLAGCGDGLFTPADCAMLGGAILGGAGLVLGPPIGFVVGSKVTYRLGETGHGWYPRTAVVQRERRRPHPRE